MSEDRKDPLEIAEGYLKARRRRSATRAAFDDVVKELKALRIEVELLRGFFADERHTNDVLQYAHEGGARYGLQAAINVVMNRARPLEEVGTFRAGQADMALAILREFQRLKAALKA